MYEPNTHSLRPVVRFPSRSSIFLMGALLLATGCSDDADVPVDAMLEFTGVTGSLTTRAHGAQGAADIPTDLSDTSIRAWTLEGDTFTEYPATGSVDGTFQIADVPEGEYYLQTSSVSYLVTDMRTADLVAHRIGRANRTRAEVSPTVLDLDIDNMSGWQDTDHLEFYAPNAGAAFSGIEGHVSIANGITALDISVDYAQHAEFPYLVDTNEGDAAYVIHHTTTMSPGGVTYFRLGEIAYLQPFSMTDGLLATATGSFTPVPASGSRAIDWPTTAFASVLDTASAKPSYGFTGLLYTYAQTYGIEASYSVPPLVVVSSDLQTDIDMTVNYGNPFAGEWGEYAWLSATGFQDYMLDGMPAVTTAGIALEDHADQLLVGALSPAFGFPRDMRLNGQDASVELDGLGTGVQVSW